MHILSWLILGGLAGWLASVLTGNNARMGVLANILVGIVGAFLGGGIFRLFGGLGVTGFNLYSFMVATVGAVALLAIARVVRRT